MENTNIEGLHPSCYHGSDCCEDSCGPVYIHGADADDGRLEGFAFAEHEHRHQESSTRIGKAKDLGRRMLGIFK